jgi:hypothetical protein
MALFNPRLQITITPGAVAVGGTVRVQWRLTGRTGRLQNLRLSLKGREEVTPVGGKNSRNERSVFAGLEIANINPPNDMRSGEATVKIPTGVVPSFAAPSNKIVWAIRVQGDIAQWPDLKEDFPITVLPAFIRRAST